MVSHTPGPWTSLPVDPDEASAYYDEHQRCAIPDRPPGWAEVSGENWFSFLYVAVCTNGEPDPEGEANLRLVLAAPDLLAALERVLGKLPFSCDENSCECGPNGDGTDEEGNVCEHVQARRAIARARGKK